MRLSECANCCFAKGCKQKAAIKKSIADSGLRKIIKPTVLRFRCKILDKAFAPGTRVGFTTNEVEDSEFTHPDGDEILHYGEVDVCGTIMARCKKTNKFRIWLDEPISWEDGYLSILARHTKELSLLKEMPIPVCRDCGRPEDKENFKEYRCDTCNNSGAVSVAGGSGSNLPF